MASTAVSKVWAKELSSLSERLVQSVNGEQSSLLVKAQKGDPVATERLIELYQDTIYSMALSFTKDRHQAEDLAQEAWIKILRGLPKFRRDSKFSTWIYRVTMNTFLNANRAARREQEVVGELKAENPGRAFPDSHAVDSTIDVQSAVRSLPAEFRSVVLLRYIADLSYKEIASVLELPLGTVQSRLRRALDKLGKRLDNQG